MEDGPVEKEEDIGVLGPPVVQERSLKIECADGITRELALPAVSGLVTIDFETKEE